MTPEPPCATSAHLGLTSGAPVIAVPATTWRSAVTPDARSRGADGLAAPLAHRDADQAKARDHHRPGRGFRYRIVGRDDDVLRVDPEPDRRACGVAIGVEGPERMA